MRHRRRGGRRGPGAGGGERPPPHTAGAVGSGEQPPGRAGGRGGPGCAGERAAPGGHDPGSRRMGRGFGLWIAGRARRSGDFPAPVLCGAAGKRRVSPKPPSQPLFEGSVLEGVLIRVCHFRVSIKFSVPADIELRTAERDRVRSIKPVGRVHACTAKTRRKNTRRSGRRLRCTVRDSLRTPTAFTRVYTSAHMRPQVCAPA